MDGDAWSERGSNRLLNKIRAYWEIRGHHPKLWLEPIKALYKDEHTKRQGTITGYVVRSDMVGGQPRKPDAIAEAA